MFEIIIALIRRSGFRDVEDQGTKTMPKTNIGPFQTEKKLQANGYHLKFHFFPKTNFFLFLIQVKQ